MLQSLNNGSSTNNYMPTSQDEMSVIGTSRPMTMSLMTESVMSSEDGSSRLAWKTNFPKLIGECDEVNSCPGIPMGHYHEFVLKIRISSVVSRKGYLNLLEESKPANWIRRWVVVRRPFLYIYAHEKDPVERGIINLATAQIQYTGSLDLLSQSLVEPAKPVNGNSRQTSARASISCSMFSLVFPHRTWLIQTIADDPREVHDWLYAFNPLLAGQIR